MKVFPDNFAQLQNLLPTYKVEIFKITSGAKSVEIKNEHDFLLATQYLTLIKTLSVFFLQCAAELTWTQMELYQKIENYFSNKIMG